jgi:hypothetical protein
MTFKKLSLQSIYKNVFMFGDIYINKKFNLKKVNLINVKSLLFRINAQKKAFWNAHMV